MSEINPCPFCGGPAERGEVDDGGKFISCTKCFASSALHYDRAENLCSNWNRRDESALAQARAEERERCAQVCDNNASDYTKEGAEVCAAEIRALSDTDERTEK